MSALLVLAAAALVLSTSPAGVPPCRSAQLAGSFSVVPGSAGAGNIVYRLRLRNRSSQTCFVSGLPRLRLLGKIGRALPTHVTPAFRPGLAAIRVVLRPGHAAKADARFSPDIPGPGEPQTRGPCEPKAYRVRITLPRGGTLVGPVSPPTSVCEHGSMSLRALSRA
jgi:hypothetical protein